MKFNFKKIASVLAGAVMATSTVAFAAAANYPAPFVKNGNADVAVVYGSLPGADVDMAAVTDITVNLQYALAKQTAGGSTTTGGVTTNVQGESTSLYSGSKKVFVNTSINTVKSILDKSDLPTVLADSSFSGDVDATVSQTIKLGSSPRVIFGKEPTSDNDPDYVLHFGGASSSYPLYNATVSFSKAVDFTDADTKGADLTLFGQKFTVASSSDNSKIVLFKSAEKISLSSDDPSTEVTVAGKKYTVELVSASDTSATIKVTDEDGNSETKEINENASKKVGGITVAVTNADETNLKLSASVMVGAEKITLTESGSAKIGEDDRTIQGVVVKISSDANSTTELSWSVYAKDSDVDAIRAGGSFVDPVVGTFKLDFAGISIPTNSTTLRENIVVLPNGDDKMNVRFTPSYTSEEKSLQWAKSTAGAVSLQGDDSGHNITVIEKSRVYRNGYVVVGNEEYGTLLKLQSIENDSDGYTNDKVEFLDVLTGQTITSKQPTAEGSTTVSINSREYSLSYAVNTANSDLSYVVLDYPDSTASGDVVVYPTIKTSKGAKLAFYEPLTMNLSNIDGSGTDLEMLKFPDGDGYTNINVSKIGEGNWTIGGTLVDTITTIGKNLTVGSLTYYIVPVSGNTTNFKLYLREPNTGAALIGNASLVIFEEKDDLTEYNALVVTVEPGNTGDDGVGVSEVIRTWSDDSVWNAISMASDSKKTKEADYYGTIALIDGSDSDQKSATISYPDEQVYANLYMSAKTAEITSSEEGGATGGTGVKELGTSIIVKDTEVSQVANKNLIVVGGSCVNKLAAELLTNKQDQVCGSNFEQLTGVGAGSFLIQTFSRTGGKVATLVAGYHAADTVNAAKYLTTQTVDTTVGKKYKGTAANKAELVTTVNNTATA